MGYKNKEEQAEYQRKWYQRNHARLRDRMASNKKQNKANVRKWFLALKRTLKCSMCEENHPACLQFHHRDRKTKRYAVGVMVNMGLAIAIIEEEIEKCDVLCGNCHSKLHFYQVGR